MMKKCENCCRPSETALCQDCLDEEVFETGQPVGEDRGANIAEWYFGHTHIIKDLTHIMK